ncbi:16S rRNA (cytidine(1402)-2'-O)-methyltransferase [Magnetospirillum sp. SS-4]|uniref:16S rRNA (cytidine(1402)-2'-O)-methyltransferase n=1 Tax=Magnetospirillum sp. SS-4 TaxID=2681465 RepID=UPI001385BB31|nr:16S rRNA (cytidine(1402)-2'-O)-methyltransferase [Magnetospirillum sp. SS-4]CAA7621320.1 putative methyltransferase [Magnetospirillum sp. SS-4]
MAGSKPAAGLYLVATPIGNLRDITLRALDVLAAADLVACEDTRVTGRLLQLLGLKADLTPYHDHNADKARPALIARLEAGAVVALVSDAGTPLVSDPGFRLVRDCVERGINVTALPGASAALAGLQLSGLPADRFLFAGFLPSRTVARRAALKELDAVPATLVFFESPHRAAETLADMAVVLGDRQAALARELTKMHEEVGRGLLSELAARYAATPPRGEVVIVVAGPGEADSVAPDQLETRLGAAIADGASLKDAAALVAAETGHPRREVYALALRLFRGGNEE